MFLAGSVFSLLLANSRYEVREGRLFFISPMGAKEINIDRAQEPVVVQMKSSKRSQSHIYTRTKPEGKAERVRLMDGKMGWIQRPQDKGTSATRKVKAPKEQTKEFVAKYIAQKPSGSAADVKAKGVWKDDVWTVEFKRKLDTGHKDDRSLEIGTDTGVSFGILRDAEHEEHFVSGPYTLKLKK